MAEKKDALAEIEEALETVIDEADNKMSEFRETDVNPGYQIGLSLTIAEIRMCDAALSLLPRLRAVVEAATSLTEINHWVERLAYYFGVERANAMSDALAGASLLPKEPGDGEESPEREGE